MGIIYARNRWNEGSKWMAFSIWRGARALRHCFKKRCSWLIMPPVDFRAPARMYPASLRPTLREASAPSQTSHDALNVDFECTWQPSQMDSVTAPKVALAGHSYGL
jgi:hypothetical protein